jgi:hypothetical protein
VCDVLSDENEVKKYLELKLLKNDLNSDEDEESETSGGGGGGGFTFEELNVDYTVYNITHTDKFENELLIHHRYDRKYSCWVTPQIIIVKKDYPIIDIIHDLHVY